MMTKQASQSAKQKVLEAASELFYHKGIHAVGVDEIARKADVAKISLYRSYPSKDDLVIAYLERMNETYWAGIDALIEATPSGPRGKLIALLSHLADVTTKSGYRGCPFLNFCGEFAEGAHLGRAQVIANKQRWFGVLERFANELGADEPSALAGALLLLVEGAYAISQVSSDVGDPGKQILRAALAVVEAYTDTSRSRQPADDVL